MYMCGVICECGWSSYDGVVVVFGVELSLVFHGLEGVESVDSAGTFWPEPLQCDGDGRLNEG